MRVNLDYESSIHIKQGSSLYSTLQNGIKSLVSTTYVPMRIVTLLSIFGSIANLIYSIYVVVISIIKEDIAQGWVSLSLQQSGMFFLISLVLLVLCEYILQVARLSNEGPPYHVAKEFTSMQFTRKEKLNIEEIDFEKIR